MKKIIILASALLLGACTGYQVKTGEATIQSPFVSPIASTPKIKQQLITLKDPQYRHRSVLIEHDWLTNRSENDSKTEDSPSQKGWFPRLAGYIKRGVASWYGPGFHGKKTANGEVFNMYKLTAAHRTLPIPSYAQVTNLKNHKSVIVRVNDRGPYSHHRLLDLSYAAAKAIGLKGTGNVEVKAVVPTNVAEQANARSKS